MYISGSLGLPLRGQKRALDVLEWESEVVVSLFF